jgi:multidrug efflux system outer membrane protein
VEPLSTADGEWTGGRQKTCAKPRQTDSGRAPERFNARGGSMAQIAIPRVTPGLPSELLHQRPDIRQAEEQLASANYSVEAARAAFFPTIQLTAQTGFQSAALSSLFGPGAWFYTAVASLTQPVFDGFLLLGQLELQRGLQTQFLQVYRKAVISAFSDVEKALIALQQLALQERYQRNVVSSSRRAFNLSEQELQQGTVNLVTLLQTEQTLFQAEDTLAQVQLARLQAVVSLYQALGGGWSPGVGSRALEQIGRRSENLNSTGISRKNCQTADVHHSHERRQVGVGHV